MNNREIYNLAKENVEKLTFSHNYKSGAESPYELGGLNKLRRVISEFEQVPFLKPGINELRQGV